MVNRQQEIIKGINKLLSKLKCHIEWEYAINYLPNIFFHDKLIIFKDFENDDLFYFGISKQVFILDGYEVDMYHGRKEDIIKYLELYHEHFINNLVINDIRNIFGESYHERYNEALKNIRMKALKAMEEAK